MLSPSDILAAARQLPRKAQTELAEALLHESGAPGGSLEPLHGMSAPDLRALSSAILAPGHQRRLKTLLRKNRADSLSEGEQTELDALLEESDRVALLKARAAYTLALEEASNARAA